MSFGPIFPAGEGCCGQCGGNGKCTQCVGTGINTHLNDSNPNCPNCRGTGVCQNCYGSGRAAAIDSGIIDLGLDKL